MANHNKMNPDAYREGFRRASRNTATTPHFLDERGGLFTVVGCNNDCGLYIIDLLIARCKHCFLIIALSKVLRPFQLPSIAGILHFLPDQDSPPAPPFWKAFADYTQRTLQWRIPRAAQTASYACCPSS